MVKIRTRLILGFVLLVGGGFYFLSSYILDYLRPRYLESVEDVLVDEAYILSAFLETQMKDGKINIDQFSKAFDQVYKRNFNAKIYRLTKTDVDERVYITDTQGIVIFDSNGNKDLGQDYSTWRNISFTLAGKYGARTTRLDYNPNASLLHITAPVFSNGVIAGTLTVSKPTANINFFMANAKPTILIAIGLAALTVIFLGIVFSIWITWPLRKLTHYARAVKDGRRVQAPNLGKSEVGEMGRAFEEMREALEGKKYVEQYVQTLTHELKSPLSAIQGAAEILEDDISPEKRQQFLKNIKVESQRMKQLVERMLELSSLESRGKLRNVQEIDLGHLLDTSITSLQSLLEKKKLRLDKQVTLPLRVEGEKFLLEQALLNLLQNAIDFSPPSSTIHIEAGIQEGRCILRIRDTGPGIPIYALPRVFEKFYSLPRPDTGKKSSGLGLSFVKEIVELHRGKIEVSNVQGGGTEVKLILPVL